MTRRHLRHPNPPRALRPQSADARVCRRLLTVVAIGVRVPYSPVPGLLVLCPLPLPFFLVLLAMVAMCLVGVEIAKAWFVARHHRVSRRAARFTTSAHAPRIL